MKIRSQIHEKRNRIFLEFQSEFDESNNYMVSHVWVDKETAEKIIEILKQSLSELS